jgi:hypothetical protein
MGRQGRRRFSCAQERVHSTSLSTKGSSNFVFLNTFYKKKLKKNKKEKINYYLKDQILLISKPKVLQGCPRNLLSRSARLNPQLFHRLH